MSELTKPASRCGAVDVLKVLAIVSVVTLHVSTNGYAAALDSADWLWAIGWGSISRAGVPIFLMCSGALLLDPQRSLSLKKLYGRNFLHILLALFFWAFAYKLFHLAAAGTLSAPALFQAVKEVLLFHHEGHLYYLHMILLVYACLPITRLVCANASRRQLEYALGLWFLLGIVYPTAKPFWPFTLLTGIPAQWALNLTYASIGYGVLGWYLRKYAAGRTRYFLLMAIGLGWTFGGTVLGSLRAGTLYTAQLNGNTVGVALLAIGICGLAFSTLRASTPARGWLYLSKSSFCVFLCHIFFLNFFQSHGLAALSGPCAITVPLLSLGVLACGVATYFVLSHIPVVSKWLI